jgi:dihydroorotate dehydrogenase (fumarate)
LQCITEAGVGRLTDIMIELEQWLVEHEYESISQLKGSVSQQYTIDPSAYERASYV